MKGSHTMKIIAIIIPRLQFLTFPLSFLFPSFFWQMGAIYQPSLLLLLFFNGCFFSWNKVWVNSVFHLFMNISKMHTWLVRWNILNCVSWEEIFCWMEIFAIVVNRSVIGNRPVIGPHIHDWNLILSPMSLAPITWIFGARVRPSY